MFVHHHEIHNYETRQLLQLHIPMFHTNLIKMSIEYQGPLIWNEISSNIDVTCSIGTFKKRASLFCTVYAIKLTICADYMDHISVVVVMSYIPCKTLIVPYIVIIHCIFWLFSSLFTDPFASALLIYPVTYVGAYMLISFLFHYVFVCTVHCEYEMNTLLSYLILKSCLSWFHFTATRRPSANIMEQISRFQRLLLLQFEDQLVITSP